MCLGIVTCLYGPLGCEWYVIVYPVIGASPLDESLQWNTILELVDRAVYSIGGSGGTANDMVNYLRKSCGNHDPQRLWNRRQNLRFCLDGTKSSPTNYHNFIKELIIFNYFS